MFRFRTILPIIESGAAAAFGGIGLWQRSRILSRPWFESQALWDTTARFHVWPWPYKFAAVSNFPALLGGLLLSIPIDAMRPTLPEGLVMAPSLVFAWLLWRWVGSRLDRRWSPSNKTPWIALAVFTVVSLSGALAPLGYTVYLPYGFVVWMLALFALYRCTSQPKQGAASGE